MSPCNDRNAHALAQIEQKKVTVWASTQRPFEAKEEWRKPLEFLPSRVRIITLSWAAASVERASISRPWRPRAGETRGSAVQVAWSRKEEFFQ